MIEAATDRDLPQVRSLLEQHHLPLDGVDDRIRTMLVARDGSQVVGTAALELYCCGPSPSMPRGKAGISGVS